MALKDSLERLQAADEDTKKVWVIASTTVIMSVIVVVWLTWFNTMTGMSVNQAAEISENVPSRGFSFFETLKSGVGAVLEKLKSPRDYLIKP